MNRSLKISVVTVTFNCDDFIEATIKSVICQTYSNIEYIIIDGGSTDRTIDIIEKYKNKIANFVSEPDNGMYDALNKGLALATGDLINFCNSDDLFYAPNIIQKVVDSYIMENFDCCYGHAVFIDSEENFLSDHYSLPFRKRYIITLGSFFMQPSFFWKRDIMLKSGLFDLNYKIASDRDFIGRILLNSKRVFRIPEKLVKFRKHGESFGDKNSEIAAKETEEIGKKLSKMANLNSPWLKLLQINDRIHQKIYRIYKSVL